MIYGVCTLTIVPMRATPDDPSEMVNQLLYGEVFKVPEKRKKWSRIRLLHDNYEGWIDNKQYIEITEEEYAFAKTQPQKLISDPVQFITTQDNHLLTTVMGSAVHTLSLTKGVYEGPSAEGKKGKKALVDTALLFLSLIHI